MLVTVKYQIGTYSGSVHMNADPAEDDATLIARAKKRLGPAPIGVYSESFKVIRYDKDSGD